MIETCTTNDCIKSTTYGPGKYFIGDPCYALDQTIYDDFWGGKMEYADGFYKEFCAFGTAYGDGDYIGTDNNTYGVDSGTLGLVDLKYKKDNVTEQWLNTCGRIVEVSEITVQYDTINNTFIYYLPDEVITIDTRYDEDDDEEDDYEEDDYEDEEEVE